MLIVRDLSFSFPGRRILDQVSFDLSSGSITCLVGGNGSGKTTLFNLITGFLRADAGSIRLSDDELIGRAPFKISRAGVARTFQDLRLIGKLTVKENLLLTSSTAMSERLASSLLSAPSARERKAEVAETETLLEDYFLMDVADHLASDISYGQQKLLTLACCATMKAQVLLLDEPVAGVSPENRMRIKEHIVRFKNQGATVLLIEHQHDFLDGVGDQFLLLEGARMHSFSTLSELRASALAHQALN